MSLAITLPGAALAALYWARYCHKGASWPKSLVKTGAVAALVLAALAAQGPALLIAALALCALGDYLLSRDSEAQFMAGIGAFAGGHIAYVVLFLTHPLADPAMLARLPQTALIAGLALFGVVMAVLLWRRAGDLRGPVMGYIPVILSMGVAVLALPALGPLAFAFSAAALFILSDFTLAMEMFVLPGAHPLRRLAPFIVWPTYWLAQLGFTLAFAPGVPA